MKPVKSPSDDRLLSFDSSSAWRAWLDIHHATESEAWLVIYKKGIRENSPALEHIVEEALCYGWIDGTLSSLDAERFALRFTPRRKNSVWAMSNIVRAEKLIKDGRMTDAGMARVIEARNSGEWKAAIGREHTEVIPVDLARALRRRRGALDGYRNLKTSRKKQLVYWLQSAKRPETRAKRIEAIVAEAGDRPVSNQSSSRR